jgi:hypothetical protein
VLRRIAGVLALALAGGLAWALAPALSTTPYAPEIEEFRQALPALERVPAPAARALRSHGHREEGGRAEAVYRSPVIEAPARFDLAGIAGEMRPYELRGRERGGEWTPWTETANGDPVWFGGADELQVRAHGWRPEGRIHYVNVSGDATPVDSLLNRARAAVSSAFISAASLLGTTAKADPPRPKVISRAGWGAERKGKRGCRPRRKPAIGGVRAAVVHHTVNANTYSEAEAPSMILGICRYHRNGNGWDDIGYNALVDRFGNVYEGRAGGLRKAVVGAHAQGFNSLTTGVAVLGTFNDQGISKKAMRGVVRFLAWKLVRHGRTTKGKAKMKSGGGPASRYPKGRVVRTKRIIGHRRVGLTACPGDALNRQIKKITRKTQRRINRFKDPKKPKDPKDPGGGSGGVGG